MGRGTRNHQASADSALMGRGTRHAAHAIKLRSSAGADAPVPAWHPDHGRQAARQLARRSLDQLGDEHTTLSDASTFEAAEHAAGELTSLARRLRDADPEIADLARRAGEDLSDAVREAFNAGLSGNTACRSPMSTSKTRSSSSTRSRGRSRPAASKPEHLPASTAHRRQHPDGLPSHSHAADVSAALAL